MTCSTRSPIRCAFSRAALLLAASLVCRAAAAQQPDEALVGELARLLAAADARVFDPGLFRETLHHPDSLVRREAALAAGRIGDAAAVEVLVESLADSTASVRAAAAFALGLLKEQRAVAPLLAFVRSVPAGSQGPPELEATTALAKIGGDDGANAVRDLLGLGSTAGRITSPVQSAALLEAWRLGTRAPLPALIGYAEDPDGTARWHALYSLARLRVARAVPVLLNALHDLQPTVRAVAVRGLTRALTDSAKLDPRDVVNRIRPLLADRDPGIRINALRALATFRDSTFADPAMPLAADADGNVAVQAETTLGVLGGARAIAALEAGLRSASFALRRQAIIALAQADSARGVIAAGALTLDADWRWRSVAAEAFGAARDRRRLEGQLGDPDGRVVAQALQALTRVVPAGDTALARRARELLAHADPAVRSVAADRLARHPVVADVDRLAQAYLRAAGDPFDDARLSAVAALGAIAQASADGRLAVASGFVAKVPRAEDYLVRRLATEHLPDAAESWGPAAPIATGRTAQDYREVARRYMVLQPAPQVTIETDRGTLVVQLLPLEAPLTVAAFLALVDRRYFDASRWHRVVPNFVVQDGDPRGDGWGGPGFMLRDELNSTRYETGTMGMALSGPDTGGSQFFFTLSAQPHLDGTYAVFGRVISGFDALGAIAQGDRIRSIHR
ncbi:MAG TPA: peptidylprolyl isomerase [Gemmatimonadales bacterium]|nr:peptidylprolyl isomerase [Gemmatimonadales bacterium]